MSEKTRNCLYKGSYVICFYDKNGEEFKYMFDNIREILKFQGKEISKNNMQLVGVELYRALKSESHLTRFLTGEILKVFIIDIN